jgi:hypothetical protein
LRAGVDINDVWHKFEHVGQRITGDPESYGPMKHKVDGP